MINLSLDMIKLIIFTVPMVGILALLVWRLNKTGFIGMTGATISYAVIAAIVIYQIVQIFSVNLPILKKGVPKDDKYNFNQVASLNINYLCVFGGELAVVSMLPSFFENVFQIAKNNNLLYMNKEYFSSIEEIPKHLKAQLFAEDVLITKEYKDFVK